MKTRYLLGLVACVFVFSVLSVSAETIQLSNGDTFSGKVISLDEKTVTLEHEVLGRVKIPREKIAAIFLREQANRPERKDFPQPGDNPEAVIDQLLKDAGKITPDVIKQLQGEAPAESKSPEDVIQQLQTNGVNSQELSEVYEKFPLLAVPGVKEYFNDKVSGLMTGRLSVEDIRKDAIQARDGLKDLQKDLGPDGRALDGYLSILNGFIDQTEPKPNAEPADKTEQK